MKCQYAKQKNFCIRGTLKKCLTQSNVFSLKYSRYCPKYRGFQIFRSCLNGVNNLLLLQKLNFLYCLIFLKNVMNFRVCIRFVLTII